MSTAQNGWPVVSPDSCVPLVVDSVRFPNGVLRGDVAYLLTDVATQWHRRVERLIKGHCWGYAKKRIGKTRVWSNHAAGCAIDINAPEHPDNTHPRQTLTTEQIDEIHAIERRYDGTVRWGGDWEDPDPMHWEVVGSASQCARVVAKLKGQPELRRGSRGGHVLKAQRILNAVPGTGADIKTDGIFGPLTESKTRRVQRHGDLADDGIIGPRTWAYLERWA